MIDLDVPHTSVHRAARRFLEPAQDLLVVGIGIALFALMVQTLVRLLRELFATTLDFRVVIAEVLFMLVMVEVVRLLIIYLAEHRVALGALLRFGDLRGCAPPAAEDGSQRSDGRVTTVLKDGQP